MSAVDKTASNLRRISDTLAGVPPLVGLDLHEYVVLLAAVEDVRDTAGALRDRIARELEPLVPGSKGVTVDGVGVVERRAGTTRKAWDHPRVAWLVASHAVDERRVDTETGETDDPVKVAVQALLDAAGIGYWRSGSLREFGLDPDDYCDTSYGPAKVILHRSDRG